MAKPSIAFGRRREPTLDTKPRVEPRIGVLIPAYNEEPVMDGTINSLLDAGFSQANIYIVDDRSTDRTAEIARARGVNVYTVPVNGGKAKAQIAAIGHYNLLSRYDWLVFLDGDTLIDKDFLREMTKAVYNDPTVGLYLGQVKTIPNNHIYSASRAFDYTYGQEIAKKAQDNFNVVIVAPGCASMYRTDLLKTMHIDTVTLAEDMDLTMQVHRAGQRVAFVPNAFVNTQDPGTFKDYHKQILRWYRGFWQVMRNHKVFSPFTKKQNVDWYIIATTADAIFVNRAFWVALIALLEPKALPWALGVDGATALLISFFVAWRTKRLDVIYKLPLYHWISYLNMYAYMRAFFEVIIMKKEKFGWNKVARYNFDDGVIASAPAVSSTSNPTSVAQ